MNAMEQQLARVELYLGDVQNLPTLPEILHRLNRMLDDPDVRISEVADLILQDQALTANLLRIANSAFFARHRQLTNIREAVVFLGFRALRNLVMTTALIRSVHWVRGPLEPRRFWEHSLATAIVCKEVADRIGFGDSETAYLAGLTHDLGIVLISEYLPEKMSLVLETIEDQSCSLYEAEDMVLGVGHTAFGAWLGIKWGFPEELVEAMFYHEEPDKQAEHAPLVALVTLSDLFCRSNGLGYGITEYWSKVVEDQAYFDVLRRYYPLLAETDWERFQMELRDRAEGIRNLVATLFRPQVQDQIKI